MVGGVDAGGFGVRLQVEPPLRWISPGILRPDDPGPPRGRYLLRTEQLVRLPRISITQHGKVLARRTIPWPASPGRVFRLPSRLFAGVDPTDGDVTVSMQS